MEIAQRMELGMTGTFMQRKAKEIDQALESEVGGNPHA